MKKSALVLTALVLGSSPLFAADVPAVSKIVKVTVYQDRALVTRSAEVTLEKGDNAIVFEGLPSALVEDSLRAQGKGVPVILQGAELKKVFTTGEADPRAALINAELEKLQDERQELEGRRETLENEKNFLNSVREFNTVQIPKEIQTHTTPTAEWMDLSQWLVDAYTKNAAAVGALNKSVRDKDKEIYAKQREYGELSGGSTERKTALVNVEAKDKGAFKVELSYIVPQAAWTLSYDAKIDVRKKTCALVSNGNVRQWSGEDWNDAALTLSSAKPAVGGRMPELLPWFLDIYQPQQPVEYERMERRRAFAAKADLMSASAEYAADSDTALMKQQSVEAVAPQAEVSQELGSVTFELTRGVTVTGDNHLYRFPVRTEEFPVTFDYAATPKLSAYAYLHSKVTNDKDHLLPGGEVNVFADDSYIGKSSIAAVGSGEKFDLYLGVDEDIKVKRTELVEKRKKTLLGLRTRKDYGYKIEVENYKKEPVLVKVIDQLPVSKNTEIKTELVSAEPKPETKDLGAIEWTLNLAPAEKKKIEFQFFVESPADKTVLGA